MKNTTFDEKNKFFYSVSIALICIQQFIMNNQTKAEALQNTKQLQEETKETKTFVQDIYKIDYINTSKIFYQKSSNSPDVKVNNYLCYQEGQNLCKITEIIYEDRIIRIEDKFEVSIDSAHLGSTYSLVEQKIEKGEKNCSRNIEKVRIFNKNVNKDSKAEKKDKKNIVKNIVKIFLSWLQKKEDGKSDSQWSAPLQELRKLMQSQNFNNRLIQKIVTNKQVSKAFMTFLEDNAEDQIKYSRIQDKQSHYQALQIYKNLLNKGSHEFSHSNHLFYGSNSQQCDDMSPSLNNTQKLEQNNGSQNALEGKQAQSNSHEAGIKIKYESTEDTNRKNKIVVVQGGSNTSRS